MKNQSHFLAALLTLALCFAMGGNALAQRAVNWQINPRGFPAETAIFVDVEDAGTYKRDLPPDAFAISLDEFADNQGGIVLNAALTGDKSTQGGWAGAQVIVLIDVSRSYTKEFALAKKMAKHLVAQMDPTRDEIAIATFPAEGGYTEARLHQTFTGSVDTLNEAIDRVALFSDDKTGGRLCNALSEALAFFPAANTDRYRTVMLLTGGADKGEGKGSCVQDAMAEGGIPFWSVGFKLDKKYDDPRNSHKIENGLYDLAQNTSGRSMFRKTQANMEGFTGVVFWNRIRSQYRLMTNFMCYAPSPEINHVSVLKVEGQPASPIKFQAAAASTPSPVITDFFPGEATRKEVDDGKIELTVDGTGFCGAPGQIRVTVNDRQVMTRSATPYRLVATLNSAIDEGTIKVTNKWTLTGESTAKFVIVKPPKGAEASKAMVILVIALVAFVILAIILIALRSRKARVPQGAPPTATQPAAGKPAGTAAATMAISQMPLAKVWVTGPGDERRQLQIGRNLIGRETHCNVLLQVDGVSREHAAIYVDETSTKVELEDLKSTNGTSRKTAQGALEGVTGRMALQPGDEIHISGHVLTVHFETGRA
ncbi:MAG: FHA domain-containing protein [Proteobacteria bacterium]|nr:FHA domain-containing protein [Pseudomonadota bacterium]